MGSGHDRGTARAGRGIPPRHAHAAYRALMLHVRSFAVATLLALVPLAGCARSDRASSDRAGDPGSPGVTAPADLLGRGPEAPPRETGITLQTVWPFIWASSQGQIPRDQVLVRRFDIVEGKHEGRVMLVTQRAADVPNAWRVERSLEGDGTMIERRVQRLSDEPALYMAEFWNDERGVRMVCEPDPLTTPAVLVPGTPATNRVKMTLPTIANARRIRERGTGEMTLEYVGDQIIETAGRRFECQKTREVFVSKLKNATATRTIERWYAPDEGLVAERWEEVVTILGGITAERSVFAMKYAGPLVPASASGAAPAVN